MHRGLVLFLSFLIATPLGAQVSIREPIVNGVTTSGPGGVGFMTMELAEGLGFCTGTLIGCRTVLTAAHCFCGQDTTGSLCNPSTNGVMFLPSGGAFSYQSVAIHPEYDFPQRDLAVVRLDDFVAGVAPIAVNRVGVVPNELKGLAVGYGLTSRDLTSTGGIKRAGLAETLACPNFVAPSSTNICAELQLPLGAPGEDSGICRGDSGGPLLFEDGSGQTIIGGVASGFTGNCEPFSGNIWARVFEQVNWIQSVGGVDVGATSCGPGPQAGEENAPLSSVSDMILQNEKKDFSLDVPSNVSLLRVALTHTPGNVDLWIRRGSPATTTQAACRSEAVPPQFPFFDGCHLNNPQAGTWYISAIGKQGSGQFQITATTFLESTGDTSPCVDGPETLCLSNGRFEVKATWQTSSGSGVGTRQQLTSDTGYFWFFRSTNVEVVVKVLDGCPVNNRFWVFAGGLTNVFTRIVVRDTQSGSVKTYENPIDTPFQPIQDTSAFATCP